MKGFFNQVSERRTVTHGGATFELPILYFRDDLFLLFFTADLERVRAQMPSPHLHPVAMPRGRALVGIAAFNYLETSIGPYGEVGMAIPVVYRDRPPLPILPAFMESRFTGFGTLVTHLPVTKTTARDAGRGEWGYPKFVADMRFGNTPEYHECELSEDGEHILTMRVMKKGHLRRDKKPLINYTVHDSSLVKTVVPQKGIFRERFNPAGSFVNFGDHPVAQSMLGLGISKKPILSRYYLERSAILPSGEVIEEGVKPYEGYFGSDRQGEHTTKYTD